MYCHPVHVNEDGPDTSFRFIPSFTRNYCGNKFDSDPLLCEGLKLGWLNIERVDGKHAIWLLFFRPPLELAFLDQLHQPLDAHQSMLPIEREQPNVLGHVKQTDTALGIQRNVIRDRLDGALVSPPLIRFRVVYP